MRTIGMVGGIGPESTIDYYRLLLSRAKERGLGAPPSLLIHSLDVQHLLALAEQEEKKLLVEYLVQSVSTLASAGAEVGFLAANTPHIVFHQVSELVTIPLVSIVTATCDVAVNRGYTRLGLIGTRFTMEGGFYQEAARRRGLEIILPDSGGRALLHSRYVSELAMGVFSPNTRQEVGQLLETLAAGGVHCVILGGTELPLLLRGIESPIPWLDTTQIHVDAVLSQAAA